MTGIVTVGCRGSLTTVPREEFFQDPAAPAAEVVAPTVFAAIRDDRGRLLLVRRVDNSNWELPGGQVEVGDSAVGALRREVAEEAGVAIDVLGVAGVCSDPAYVIRSSAGQVRQPFAVCFHATPTPATAHPQPDHAETSEASRTDPAELDSLRVHPAMRRWIDDALARPHTEHQRFLE